MGFDLGTVSATVVLDDSDYRRGLSGLESASAGTFRRIAGYAAGYLSVWTGNLLNGTDMKKVESGQDSTSVSAHASLRRPLENTKPNICARPFC